MSSRKWEHECGERGCWRCQFGHGERVSMWFDVNIWAILGDVAVIIVAGHHLKSAVGRDQDDDDLEGAGEVPGVALCGIEGHDLAPVARGAEAIPARQAPTHPASGRGHRAGAQRLAAACSHSGPLMTWNGPHTATRW